MTSHSTLQPDLEQAPIHGPPIHGPAVQGQAPDRQFGAASVPTLGTSSSLLRAELSFALAMLVVFPVFACWGRYEIGAEGVRAAFLAMGICWTAGALGLAATARGRAPNSAISAALAGTLFRMALPLVALIALPNLFPGRFGECVVKILVGYYLFGLMVEVSLILKFLRIPQVSVQVSSPKAV